MLTNNEENRAAREGDEQQHIAKPAKEPGRSKLFLKSNKSSPDSNQNNYQNSPKTVTCYEFGIKGHMEKGMQKKAVPNL